MDGIGLILSLLLGQAAPDVVVQTVEGPKPAAPLLEIEADFTIKLGGPKPVAIPGQDVIALRRVGASQPGACSPPYLQLTTGDRLPLAAVLLDDETLHVTLAAPFANEKLNVPQAAAAFIALTDADVDVVKGERDVIVLKNGDRLAGKLSGLDGEQASLAVNGAKQSIPLDRIRRIAFNPAFQTRPNPKAPYAEVAFANGTRLALAKLASVGSGGRLSGVSLFGQRYSFAVGDVAAVRIRRGKAVYLDELKPASYESTPFLDVEWPLAVGRTVAGGSLTIGADVYPSGLGMHSRSRATYALDGKDAWFEAVVAIDEIAGPRGEVKIDVEVDGKSTGTHVVKAGAAPVSLRIDVRNAKTITLVTDFGPRGDVQGHAIWADARLIRLAATR